MKKVYRQLTREQSYKLESYLDAVNSQHQISLLLSFYRSTIRRELARIVAKIVVGAKVYYKDKAQTKEDKRDHL